MEIQVLKSKIHRAKVTQAELHYVGSVTLDEELMEASNLIENELVHVLNIANGERFETYVITGARGTGTICLNGAAARKVQKGDILIIISYFTIAMDVAKTFKPWIVFPDENNMLK